MCRSRSSYRIISIVVLSFYIWTFGGLSSIAHAAKDAVNQAQIKEKSQKKEQSPEERFEKATQEIEAILADTKTETESKIIKRIIYRIRDCGFHMLLIF